MKNLRHHFRTWFLRVLLLMAVLEESTPAETIGTESPAGERNSSWITEIPKMPNEMQLTPQVTTSTQLSTTWQENNAIKNETETTKRNTCTPQLITLRDKTSVKKISTTTELIGEPSAPERGMTKTVTEDSTIMKLTEQLEQTTPFNMNSTSIEKRSTSRASQEEWTKASSTTTQTSSIINEQDVPETLTKPRENTNKSLADPNMSIFVPTAATAMLMSERPIDSTITKGTAQSIGQKTSETNKDMPESTTMKNSTTTPVKSMLMNGPPIEATTTVGITQSMRQKTNEDMPESTSTVKNSVTTPVTLFLLSERPIDPPTNEEMSESTSTILNSIITPATSMILSERPTDPTTTDGTQHSVTQESMSQASQTRPLSTKETHASLDSAIPFNYESPTVFNEILSSIEDTLGSTLGSSQSEIKTVVKQVNSKSTFPPAETSDKETFDLKNTVKSNSNIEFRSKSPIPMTNDATNELNHTTLKTNPILTTKKVEQASQSTMLPDLTTKPYQKTLEIVINDTSQPTVFSYSELKVGIDQKTVQSNIPESGTSTIEQNQSTSYTLQVTPTNTLNRLTTESSIRETNEPTFNYNSTTRQKSTSKSTVPVTSILMSTSAISVAYDNILTKDSNTENEFSQTSDLTSNPNLKPIISVTKESAISVPSTTESKIAEFMSTPTSQTVKTFNASNTLQTIRSTVRETTNNKTSESEFTTHERTMSNILLSETTDLTESSTGVERKSTTTRTILNPTTTEAIMNLEKSITNTKNIATEPTSRKYPSEPTATTTTLKPAEKFIPISYIANFPVTQKTTSRPLPTIHGSNKLAQISLTHTTPVTPERSSTVSRVQDKTETFVSAIIEASDLTSTSESNIKHLESITDVPPKTILSLTEHPALPDSTTNNGEKQEIIKMTTVPLTTAETTKSPVLQMTKFPPIKPINPIITKSSTETVTGAQHTEIESTTQKSFGSSTEGLNNRMLEEFTTYSIESIPEKTTIKSTQNSLINNTTITEISDKTKIPRINSTLEAVPVTSQHTITQTKDTDTIYNKTTLQHKLRVPDSTEYAGDKLNSSKEHLKTLIRLTNATIKATQQTTNVTLVSTIGEYTPASTLAEFTSTKITKSTIPQRPQPKNSEVRSTAFYYSSIFHPIPNPAAKEHFSVLKETKKSVPIPLQSSTFSYSTQNTATHSFSITHKNQIPINVGNTTLLNSKANSTLFSTISYKSRNHSTYDGQKKNKHPSKSEMNKTSTLQPEINLIPANTQIESTPIFKNKVNIILHATQLRTNQSRKYPEERKPKHEILEEKRTSAVPKLVEVTTVSKYQTQPTIETKQIFISLIQSKPTMSEETKIKNHNAINSRKFQLENRLFTEAAVPEKTPWLRSTDTSFTASTRGFGTSQETGSKDWQILKRKKTKISNQKNQTLSGENMDPLSTNYISRTKNTNVTILTVGKTITRVMPTKNQKTIHSTLNIYNHTPKFQNNTNKKHFDIDYDHKEESSSRTQLATSRNHSNVYGIIKPTNNDPILITTLNVLSTTLKPDKKINTTLVKYIPRNKHRAKIYKTNNTRKIGKFNKELSKHRSHFTLRNQEHVQGWTNKSPISDKNGKGKINHIEEILQKYYEEFKNRNTMANSTKKSIPAKRKIRIKKRPIMYEANRNNSVICTQPTVVDRKLLNSSHMSMNYVVKEQFINYRSLEYLDLSHNSIVRFNLSTLNNLNTLKYVTLEYNNLTDLYPINFYSIRNLEYLELSHNNISKIRNFTFTHMKSLKYLNLNDNFISKINATTLKGLQGLLHLDLSNNKIDYIHQESLPKILSLKYLNLSRNRISTLAIANLKNIQAVDLSYNEINSFDNITLGNLTNQMKVLKVNNNLLEHLNENIFKNFSKLIYLDVSNNKLNFIAPSTFQYLTNLILLNVSCQNILPIDQKGSTYFIDSNVNRYDENFTSRKSNVRWRNKTNVVPKKSLYKIFTHEITRNDEFPSYESEDAKNGSRVKNMLKNKIMKGNDRKETKQTISNRIMKRTNSKNKNKFKFVSASSDYNESKQSTNNRNRRRTSTMRNIPDIIDFKLNLLASISQRLKQFECINVNLNQVPKVLTHSIQILNLRLNKIKIIQLGDFDDYPLLQILILSQNKIKSIETDSLGRLDYLKILLVDDNKLKSIPISLPENIEILNLNYNIISRIGQEDFFDLVNIQKLYLQGNKLDYIPANTFLFLRNLKHLDLSNNPIKTITSITLGKLNFINLSNLKQIESNSSDRFPIEDGYSLIGIKLTDSAELCRLLIQDYAFVLTLKQMKYLNCNQTEIKNEFVSSTVNESRRTNNHTCSQSKKSQEHESKIPSAITPNSPTNNKRTKFITSRKTISPGQTNECVNNDTNVFQIRNLNTVRKRSNKAYGKTINSNLTVNNNIIFNVNNCTICKVNRTYESMFEFHITSIDNYIEKIVSFENVLNYTNTRTYLQYVSEEMRGDCLLRGNKTRGYSRKTDVNIENYTPMNNSTDVLKFPTRSNNIGSFANNGKPSSNRIFMENSSDNEGIFVITKESDIPTTEFSFGRDRASRNYSKISFKERYLKSLDFEMNDQAIVAENNKEETVMANRKNETYETRENMNPTGEENKFSIVRDSKKNVILKLLNRFINNETDEKRTENYDQLEIKEASKTADDKADEENKQLSSEQVSLTSNKKITRIKNNKTIEQHPNERNASWHENIKSDLIDITYDGMENHKSSSPSNKFHHPFKTNSKQYLEDNQKHSLSHQSTNGTPTQDKSSNTPDPYSNKGTTTLKFTENIHDKHKEINKIRAYLKNYKSIDPKLLEEEHNRLEEFANEGHDRNKLEYNSNVHKDAQYEMNIVDTDAEFLDIVDDKTEKTNDNTVRTLETSKYHELVSSSSPDGLEYHTGMIIFLMIVACMIVGSFLALTFQWNTLLHYYCHHYVTYRNNGHSDDEDNHSDSNFDRIEMLDNADVYSIT